MLVQIQEQKSKLKQKQKIKLSQILKNATERQCFGHFMKISEITDRGECHDNTSKKTVHEVCVNGLLMLKAEIVDESSTLSLYGYVADDADILKVYRSLGIDPYHRIKCHKCDLLGNGYHLYRVLEHMNDYHRASFKEIGSYLETLGLFTSKIVKIRSTVLKPYEYHNHTFWPWTTGTEMLATSRFMQYQECDVLLSKLAPEEHPHIHSFYEWIDPIEDHPEGSFPFRTGISAVRIAIADIIQRIKRYKFFRNGNRMIWILKPATLDLNYQAKIPSILQ